MCIAHFLQLHMYNVIYIYAELEKSLDKESRFPPGRSAFLSFEYNLNFIYLCIEF